MTWKTSAFFFRVFGVDPSPRRGINKTQLMIPGDDAPGGLLSTRREPYRNAQKEKPLYRFPPRKHKPGGWIPAEKRCWGTFRGTPPLLYSPPSIFFTPPIGCFLFPVMNIGRFLFPPLMAKSMLFQCTESVWWSVNEPTQLSHKHTLTPHATSSTHPPDRPVTHPPTCPPTKLSYPLTWPSECSWPCRWNRSAPWSHRSVVFFLFFFLKCHI